MKILVQNLQKRKNLATQLVEEHDADIILAQEINLYSEQNYGSVFEANYVSSMGYGTAIGLGYKVQVGAGTNGEESASTSTSTSIRTSFRREKIDIIDIKKVQSPYTEFGSMIHKKTTIATICKSTRSNGGGGSSSGNSSSSSSHNVKISNRIELISFHGYNGQPFKNKDKLVAHVKAVIQKISPTGPALFAGDFNTWSQEHIDAVSSELKNVGFRLVYSWPYPGRDVDLDHAFVRDLELKGAESYTCASDHKGAILYID